MGSQIPIIDSHIHLFPASALSTLAWQKPDGPLYKQQSLDEFKAATSTGDAVLKGYIFIEADRKSSAAPSSSEDDSGWAEPLAEVEFVRRLATGQPLPGEGHSDSAADAALCLAAVPWAPVPAGPEALERYLARAREAAGEAAWPRVRGFRYLLQDKPSGTALQDGFIESLRLLGRRGFAFDVGVDQHRRGRLQLEEAVEMIDRAHDGVPEAEKVVFVL
ncbi:L-rhamnono-gamma-lactonase, partial [Diatrype stigma]